jgi:tetratricopeptide (TPR) repeat protein
VLTLSHHAAVISNFLRNFSRAKHYYEKSLEFNPENPVALYGLAEVALKQGDADLAKEYAKKSYDVMTRLYMAMTRWPKTACST